MSTASHLCRRKEVSLCFTAQVLHSQSTASVKKSVTGWEHLVSLITDHLKPPTAAKRCTSLESRKSPALRDFVAGRWALATTSLYPSTKIERPQRARNPRFGGTASTLPRNRHTGLTRPRQGVPSGSTVLCLSHRMPLTGQKWVRASARKCARLPLAASQVLCLPHQGWVKLLSRACR